MIIIGVTTIKKMRRIEIGGQGLDYERCRRNDKGLIAFFKTRYDEKLIFFS